MIALKRAEGYTSPVEQGELLYKTTVNSVIDTIGHLIQGCMSKDVQKAGMFSVQLDTTQDMTSQDQCSVILKYVTETVHERLIALVRCQASTGQYPAFRCLRAAEIRQGDIYLECNRWGVQYAGQVQRFFSTDDLPVFPLMCMCGATLMCLISCWLTLLKLSLKVEYCSIYIMIYRSLTGSRIRG